MRGEGVRGGALNDIHSVSHLRALQVVLLASGHCSVVLPTQAFDLILRKVLYEARRSIAHARGVAKKFNHALTHQDASVRNLAGLCLQVRRQIKLNNRRVSKKPTLEQNTAIISFRQHRRER